MTFYDRRVGLTLFTLSVVLALTGAGWPLNPLVTRNAQPSGPVPVECEQGLTPARSPRVNVAEIPEREIVLTAATIPAPPSRSLRGELESAQTALARNDRPAFDEHLDNVRDLLRDYPSGAERTAAGEVVRVLDDAAHVWDAQFESPFFGAGSDAYARAKRYPGYEDAVRRSLLMDDADHRFYPAAESRDFLTHISAQRLSRLGIRTTPAPTRVARAETPRRPTSKAATSKTAKKKTATKKTGTKKTAPSSTVARTTPHHPSSHHPSPRRTTPRRGPTKTALSKPAASPAPALRSPDRVTQAPAAAAPAPAAPPVTTPRASAVSTVPPAAEVPPPSTGTTTIGSNPSPSQTAAPMTTTETTASATETTASATESTDTGTTTPAERPERRSVVIPALLILIGLGVLIVLFRASR